MAAGKPSHFIGIVAWFAIILGAYAVFAGGGMAFMFTAVGSHGQRDQARNDPSTAAEPATNATMLPTFASPDTDGCKPSTAERDSPAAFPWWLYGIPALAIGFGALCFAAGWGLLRRRRWAASFFLVASVVAVATTFGFTALTTWAFFHEGSKVDGVPLFQGFLVVWWLFCSTVVVLLGWVSNRVWRESRTWA